MGTYFGLHIQNSIANTRAIGAVLGGPVIGGLVGLIVAGVRLLAEVVNDHFYCWLVRWLKRYSLNITAPMIVTTAIGSAMFMRILLDRRVMIFEKYTSVFSARKIVACTEGILRQGFNQENNQRVARSFTKASISAWWRLPAGSACWRLSHR